MPSRLSWTATALLASVLGASAQAGVIDFDFSGAGVKAQIQLTYSPASPQGVLSSRPNTNYPVGSSIVTGISGTFSDAATPTPIVDATITGMVAPTDSGARDPANILAPHSLSFLPSGLSYDNLLYLDGAAPTVATGYDLSGGYFDIYGLAFTFGGSSRDVVNLWNNGSPTGTGTDATYGVAVTDGVNNYKTPDGVAQVPEPAMVGLLGLGLGAVSFVRRRR